jgi:uncharacterized protein YggE
MASRYKVFTFSLALGLGLVSTSPTYAQTTSEAAFIETNGVGLVALDYDQFRLGIQSSGRGDTRAAALRAASARADVLRATLGRIAGVSGFKVTATEPSIIPIGPGCENFRSTTCTPTGYFARIETAVVAKPATAAAAAVVVLEEQGFSVGEPTYSVESIANAATASRRLAFENARASADIAATTAGCRRGKLINIVMRNDPSQRDENVVVVTGTRRAGDGKPLLEPSFNLQLEAGKANIVAEVRTKFELLCR